MAFTLVCLTMLVIATTRIDRQADGLASILAFGLTLLGGNFVFIGAAPPIVHTLALFTPNGWALRAFTDLSGGAGWTAVVQPLLAILAFCAAITAAVTVLTRRAGGTRCAAANWTPSSSSPPTWTRRSPAAARSGSPCW